MPEFLTCFLFG